MYDGWLPYPPDPADYKAALADVQRAAEAHGRAPDAVTPALFASVLIEDDPAARHRTLERFALSNYGLPLDEVRKIQAVAAGSADEVVAQLAEYTAGGARHLVLRLGTTGLGEIDEQLDRVADLLPRLR